MNETDDFRELSKEEYNQLSRVDKQRYTYAKNKRARDAANAKRWAQQREDREANMTALRMIRDDANATPDQRKFAVLCLDDMMGLNCVPYYLTEPMKDEARRSQERDMEEFRKRLKERHPELWAEVHGEKAD